MKDFDNSFITRKIKFIAGCDEAGRGPPAGPVLAASVIFKPNVFIEGVNDSKQLNEEQRDELFPLIIKKASAFSVCSVSHGTIDRINILQASLLALRTSAMRLNVQPDLILIDGNKSFSPFNGISTIPVIHGDSKSFAIAAASIIAKVTRDRIMKNLSLRFPNYLWYKNKGYATAEHIEAIKTCGSCILHRQTFLRKILYNDIVPEFDFEENLPEE